MQASIIQQLSSSTNTLSASTSCNSGKLSCLSLASVKHARTAPFQIIHSDGLGPALALSFTDHCYFVLLVDDIYTI